MAEIDRSLPHYEVRLFLSGARQEIGPSADKEIARLLGWREGPAYSSDINAVVQELQRMGWWWSLSHIIAEVSPTTDADGPLKGLVSNATRHDREGSPIEYKDYFAKDQPAISLCVAAIKAAYDLPDAFYVDASHSRNILSKEPASTDHMMAYYKAREDDRQERIAWWNANHPGSQLTGVER